jgi:hypothetical protein
MAGLTRPFGGVLHASHAYKSAALFCRCRRVRQELWINAMDGAAQSEVGGPWAIQIDPPVLVRIKLK